MRQAGNLSGYNLFNKIALYDKLKFKNYASAERLMRSLHKDVQRGLVTQEDLRTALQAYDYLQTGPSVTKLSEKPQDDWVKKHLYFEDKLKVRRAEKGLRPHSKPPLRTGRNRALKRTRGVLLSDLGRGLEKKVNLAEFLNFTRLDVEPIGGGASLYEANRLGNLLSRGQQFNFKSHETSTAGSGWRQNLRYFGETPPSRRERSSEPIVLQDERRPITSGLSGVLTAHKFFFETPLVPSLFSKKEVRISKSPTQSRHSLLGHYKKDLSGNRAPAANIEDEIWSKIKITLLGLNAYPRFQTGSTREVREEKSEYFIGSAKKNFEKIRNRHLVSLMDSASVRQFRIGIQKSPNQFKAMRDELKLSKTRQSG